MWPLRDPVAFLRPALAAMWLSGRDKSRPIRINLSKFERKRLVRVALLGCANLTVRLNSERELAYRLLPQPVLTGSIIAQIRSFVLILALS